MAEEEKKESIFDTLLKPLRNILGTEGEERESLADRIEKLRESLGIDQIDSKIKAVIQELEVPKRVEKIRKINEILGITEQYNRLKEFIERLDLPERKAKLEESLDKIGIKSERVEDILEDLGVKEREEKVLEILDVAGLKADWEELKKLLGL